MVFVTHILAHGAFSAYHPRGQRQNVSDVCRLPCTKLNMMHLNFSIIKTSNTSYKVHPQWKSVAVPEHFSGGLTGVRNVKRCCINKVHYDHAIDIRFVLWNGAIRHLEIIWRPHGLKEPWFGVTCAQSYVIDPAFTPDLHAVWCKYRFNGILIVHCMHFPKPFHSSIKTNRPDRIQPASDGHASRFYEWLKPQWHGLW